MSVHVISDLWQRQPGRYFCLATKDSDGRWHDHFFERGECDIEEFVQDHEDENLYFCPHGFDRRRRIKDNAVLPKLLWADLDAVDPRRIAYRPTIAIRSSPGRYVGLWRTDKVISEQLNQRMTRATGADRGNWKLTQVLRVPGTINHKYDDKPIVKVLWDSGPTYKVADLDDELPKLSAHIALRGKRRASKLTESEIFQKHSINGALRYNLASDSPHARRQRRVNDWLDAQTASSKDLHHVQRWRFHFKLACDLHERGVPADEAFVLLWGTAWNKHKDAESVWRLVERVWRT